MDRLVFGCELTKPDYKCETYSTLTYNYLLSQLFTIDTCVWMLDEAKVPGEKNITSAGLIPRLFKANPQYKIPLAHPF